MRPWRFSESSRHAIQPRQREHNDACFLTLMSTSALPVSVIPRLCGLFKRIPSCHVMSFSMQALQDTQPYERARRLPGRSVKATSPSPLGGQQHGSQLRKTSSRIMAELVHTSVALQLADLSSRHPAARSPCRDIFSCRPRKNVPRFQRRPWR